MGNSACFSGLAVKQQVKKEPFLPRQVTLSEMLDEQDKPVRGDSRSTLAPSESAWSESAWSSSAWSSVGDEDIDDADELATALAAELSKDAKLVFPSKSKKIAVENRSRKSKTSMMSVANRTRVASAPAAGEMTADAQDLYACMFDSKPTPAATLQSKMKPTQASAHRWSISGDMFASTVDSTDDDDLLREVVRPRNSHYA